MIVRAALATVVGIVCLCGAINSFSFPAMAGYFPRFAGTIGFALSLVELLSIARERYRRRVRKDSGNSPVTGGEKSLDPIIFLYAGWAVFLVILLYVFGVFIAAAVWLLAYLRLTTRMRWTSSLLAVLVVEGAVFGLQYVGLLVVPVGLVA